MLKLLAHYLRPYRWLLLGVIVFQFASALASLALPSMNAAIIDQGVAKGDIDYVWRTGGWMLLVAFGQIACSVVATFVAARASMALGRDLRNDIFTKVSGFSEREISTFGPGSLITRNTNDVQQVQMVTMMSSTYLVTAPLMAIGGIIFAVRQSLQLSWIIAISVTLLLVIAAVVISRMVPLFRQVQDKVDTVNRVMREQLTGIRVIRAFVREKIETARFNVANLDLTVVGRKVGSLFVLLFPLVMVTFNITVIAVIWFGGIAVDHGTVEIGTLFAFMQYAMQILMGIMIATFMTMMIPRAAVSAERISKVLATDTTLHGPEHPVTDLPTPGEIAFDRVSFTYPGAQEPVLHDLAFTVEPGQTVAVVGATGAGKSTLVNLIPRLVDVTSGSVRLHGVDVREQDLEQLWQSIGLVPQRPFLFQGTVATNLRFGKDDATNDELWQALKIAQAADFVRDMPLQLDGPIAQGGTNVSGGQRQRLAIARAIIHHPQILVFDDSFSALDLETDARLRAALWQALPKVTKLVVAQRVSTITDAAQIIVLDHGSIVGIGTHDDLLKTCETYAEIVRSQQAAEVA